MHEPPALVRPEKISAPPLRAKRLDRRAALRWQSPPTKRPPSSPHPDQYGPTLQPPEAALPGARPATSARALVRLSLVVRETTSTQSPRCCAVPSRLCPARRGAALATVSA